ncbi:hypothetical protein F7725_023616 [Dissostichus mawsoni]|uniref:Uncharacterized protein n=1 Tax=Dissostichus mawsoni TaxID=36200 RepID=A0A7J5XX30_DISMA|nr:hypothetical protein F7725_023616 [Dissostichus mawsoni]
MTLSFSSRTVSICSCVSSCSVRARRISSITRCVASSFCFESFSSSLMDEIFGKKQEITQHHTYKSFWARVHKAAPASF